MVFSVGKKQLKARTQVS